MNTSRIILSLYSNPLRSCTGEEQKVASLQQRSCFYVLLTVDCVETILISIGLIDLYNLFYKSGPTDELYLDQTKHVLLYKNPPVQLHR